MQDPKIQNQWGRTGASGENGYGYQNFYYVSTKLAISVPSITYNGMNFSADPNWVTTIPTTPVGANIFITPVRYQEGKPGQIIEGIALFGTIPETIKPEPKTVTYNNGIEYGTANEITPEGPAQNTGSFSLAVGQTYTTPNLDFPNTTNTAGNYYIKLPDGLILTKAVDSLQGDETDSWIRVGISQIWVFVIGFAGGGNTFSFTVSRNS